MVAEKHYRGQGLGMEAMLLMLRYGVETLKIKCFEAKIKFDNGPSAKMFHKIGFQEVSRSDVFREVTLKCEVDSDFMNFLKTNITICKIKEYVH